MANIFIDIFAQKIKKFEGELYMHDIIVIGAGIAGLTAALYSHRAGNTVFVLESLAPGGQAINTPHIENWPGTINISGPDFALELYNQTQRLGIEIKFEKATNISDDANLKIVHCGDKTYKCKTIILANGLQRKKLNIPGEKEFEGRGISYCAICDGSFFKDKNVAVIGGGNTALEDALYLSTICPIVWLINNKTEFKAQQFLIDNVQKNKNIKLLIDCNILEITGNENAENVIVSNSQKIEELYVNGIFVAIGFKPQNTTFSPPLLLDEEGFVIAEEDCATNIPGIFAAGDCRSKEFRQFITAASDGAIAASKAGQYIMSL